jgi:antitoxin component of RelBE/YafQ-DinJ toxin-antitoxin module
MGVESPKYDLPEQFGKLSREEQKKWLIYLNSPDERLAHISQIKYFISSGLGREQILRILLKDWAEYDNLPLAKKYDEFINIAQKELEEQDERRAEEKRVNEAFKKLTQQEMETSPSEYLSEGYFDRDALL